MQIRSIVNKQQTVVTHHAEKAQHQALFSKHGPIHTARSLGPEDEIFAAQTQQVPMQIVGAPVAFAFVLEAIVAAWYGGKRFGRPLTNDQRARIAITYTLIVAVVLTPAFALGWMPGSKVLLDRLDGLSSGGVLAALGLSLLGLATIALARYLVLSAVSPLVSPLKKAKAGAGA